MTYTDDRNWDQKELDRARELAKDNVVSDGASVPSAARLKADQVPDNATPSPVLEGERITTEQERKAVEENGPGVSIPSEDNVTDDKSGKTSGKEEFEQNNVRKDSDADSAKNRQARKS